MAFVFFSGFLDIGKLGCGKNKKSPCIWKWFKWEDSGMVKNVHYEMVQNASPSAIYSSSRPKYKRLQIFMWCLFLVERARLNHLVTMTVLDYTRQSRLH